MKKVVVTRRKSNVGRVLPLQWVLGGLRRKTKSFLVVVPDLSAKTLLDVVEKNASDGRIISSDYWQGCKIEDLT